VKSLLSWTLTFRTPTENMMPVIDEDQGRDVVKPFLDRPDIDPNFQSRCGSTWASHYNNKVTKWTSSRSSCKTRKALMLTDRIWFYRSSFWRWFWLLRSRNPMYDTGTRRNRRQSCRHPRMDAVLRGQP